MAKKKIQSVQRNKQGVTFDASLVQFEDGKTYQEKLMAGELFPGFEESIKIIRDENTDDVVGTITKNPDTGKYVMTLKVPG